MHDFSALPVEMQCFVYGCAKNSNNNRLYHLKPPLLEFLYGWRNGLQSEQRAEPSRQVCDSPDWQSQCCRPEVPVSAAFAAAAGWCEYLTSVETPASKRTEKKNPEWEIITDKMSWIRNSDRSDHVMAENTLSCASVSTRWSLCSSVYKWRDAKGMETHSARVVDEKHCSCKEW